jgi:hypothetical protein
MKKEWIRFTSAEKREEAAFASRATTNHLSHSPFFLPPAPRSFTMVRSPLPRTLTQSTKLIVPLFPVHLEQSTGVTVSQECLSAFQELKTGKKIKYIIYGMSPDNSQIVVLETSTEKSYDAFIEKLPETECRWAVYDFEFDSGEGIRNKLCFYMW